MRKVKTESDALLARNALQLQFALILARRHGITLSEAVERIASPFATLYPSKEN